MQKICFLLSRVFILLAAVISVSHQAVQATTVIATIPVGTNPSRAVITPNGAEVYVSNMGSNTVSVIKTATNKVTNTILVGSQPDSLVVAPDGAKVYVGQHGGNVSVIDTTTKAVSMISTGSPVRDLAITPDGSKLYLAMEFSGLNKIMTNTNAVISVSSTVCPEAVVFTTTTARAYVNYQCAPFPGIPGHDPIYAFNAATDTFMSAIAFLPDGIRIPNVGSVVMAISPNDAQVWANGADACSGNYDHAGCPIVPAGVVNVIRTSDNMVVKTIGFPNGAGIITISPDSSQAFVGGQSLLIFDTSTFAQVDSVAIAASGSLAFIPDGSHAYAPVPSENAVKVLQTSPSPVPDIKANGSDGPVIISAAANLTLTAALNAFGSTANSDWWVKADTPFGIYSFKAATRSWVPGIKVAYQGRLMDLAAYEVLNQTGGLPAGTYNIMFGVDSNMNGVLDNDLLISDSVSVTVTASINDFVGTWKGSLTFSSIGENFTCSDSTIVLALNGAQLDGTLTGANCVGGGSMGTNNISGTVSNGTFSFNLPNSDPNNPDCANWNVPMTASLEANMTSMTVNGSGTFCGPGGGKQGTLTGSLAKQ